MFNFVGEWILVISDAVRGQRVPDDDDWSASRSAGRVSTWSAAGHIANASELSQPIVSGDIR